MLTGKELGEAITSALALKGRGSQKDLAVALGIKPPSINDMKKFGRIDKKHLPALWKFFSDVVGPEHWDIKQYTWQEEPKIDIATELALSAIQKIGKQKFTVFSVLSIDNPESLENFDLFKQVMADAYNRGVADATQKPAA